MTRRTRSSSIASSFTESPKRFLRSQNHDAFLELPNPLRPSRSRASVAVLEDFSSESDGDVESKKNMIKFQPHSTTGEKISASQMSDSELIAKQFSIHFNRNSSVLVKTNMFEDLKTNEPIRNLRSSGIKCDPDFYSLSLELEQKRQKHPRSPLKKITEENALPQEKEDEEIFQTKVNIASDKQAKPQLPAMCVSHNETSIQGVKYDTVRETHSPPPLFEDTTNTESDVYCFESDHVALRQNFDYHQLLQTVSLLEAQKQRALDDIELLEQKRNLALQDPLAFVEKLQTGEDYGLPHRQNIATLPKIDWSKYTSAYGTFSKVFSKENWETNKKKHGTRKKQINFKTGVPVAEGEMKPQKPEKPKLKNLKVFWSVAEQRQLEELLRKYPSESNEFNRYRKIAAELDNRTPLQVQSRVQKYFIKLAKAGLPIPGRMPNYDRHACNKRRALRARRHKDAELLKISTFFTKFHVPVRMEENSGGESDNGTQGWTTNQDDEVSDEEDIPHELRFSDEYLEIMKLKKLRKGKLGIFQSDSNTKLAEHTGFECDMCQCNPIKGVRYHCIDCESEDAVDLCQTCIRSNEKYENKFHQSNHRMEPVYKAQTFEDSDYTNFLSRTGEYNYLDPNYITIMK